MDSKSLAHHRYVADHDPFTLAQVLYENGHHTAVEVYDLNRRPHSWYVGAPRPSSGAAGRPEGQYHDQQEPSESPRSYLDSYVMVEMLW